MPGQHHKTQIMGILNATPDSFSGDGEMDRQKLLSRGLSMVEQGADIIDVGGESSRPFAEPVSVDEEKNRVIPVIKLLTRNTLVPVSIDTYHPETALAALGAGASIINDISGLRNPEMISIAKHYNASVIVMHMLGSPGTMQSDPSYSNVLSEVIEFLSERVTAALQSGIAADKIILDPGIGFGKKLAHNLTLIQNLDRIKALGYPVLLGPSRKSFIGELLDRPVEDRLEGTLAAIGAGVTRGADIVRVHDVGQVKRFLGVLEPILESETKA